MRRLLIIFWVACCLVAASSSQRAGDPWNAIRAEQTDDQTVKSRQTNAERSQLTEVAEKNHYTVRRVEFIGNQHIRDSTLRRRVLSQEGDVFNLRTLEKSLRNLSRLRIIYPVTLNDVDFRLDRENKLVDFAIFFRERPHVRRGKKFY